MTAHILKYQGFLAHVAGDYTQAMRSYSKGFAAARRAHEPDLCLVIERWQRILDALPVTPHEHRLPLDAQCEAQLLACRAPVNPRTPVSPIRAVC